MADETPAPEADPSAPAEGISVSPETSSTVTDNTFVDAPAPEVASEAAPAPEAAPEAEPEPAGEDDGTRPEPPDESDGDLAADETEPALAEEEVPEGGLLGDNSIRVPTAEPHDVEAIQAGTARITRDQLAEIDNRRAQSDIATLVAACSSLLDELEA